MSFARGVSNWKWGVLLGLYMARGGNGTGADETKWRQPKPVDRVTLSAPVWTPLVVTVYSLD